MKFQATAIRVASASHASTSPPSIKVARTGMLWRVHWWAALISTPFALLAALTGILYIFTPQIEQGLYGRLDRVSPASNAVPLAASIAAAVAAAPPDMALRSVVVPASPGDSIKVQFQPSEGGSGEHAHHQHQTVASSGAPVRKPAFGSPAGAVTVYVDPTGGRVLGVLANDDRFSNWAKRLHSRLLQGDSWRWMIELATSWLFVMLVTGVALWWPHARWPRAGRVGREAWRQWHSFFGVALGTISLIILLTGLTWSKYAGDNVRMLRDLAGQASPQAPKGLKSQPVPDTSMLGWQAAWEKARSYAPAVDLQLTAPSGNAGVWRAAVADRRQPGKRLDLVLDAYTGAVLYRSGWDQQTAFGKATAIGIPFHRGEFGIWNQAVLLVFGLGIVFSIVSGWMMYFKRRKAGSLAMPRVAPGSWKRMGIVWYLGAAALLALMPMLLLSAPIVAVADFLLAKSAHRKYA